IEQTIVVIVSERNAHGGHDLAGQSVGHAGGCAGFAKFPVAFVVIEIGRDAVVGNEEIGPAVVVVVCGTNREILPVGLVDARGLGHVWKRAVAVVVVEHGRASVIGAGRATGLEAAQVAIATGAGTVRDVAADIKIKLAVAVVIEKSGAGVEPSPEFHA